jgi:hypothetical protein
MDSRLLSTFFLLFAVGITALQAQFRLPSGGWDNLLPFQRGAYVTQSETEVFYTTGLGIVALDKEELSTRTLTRADGLAETRIRLLSYHRPSETLIIVYENSTIDLYREGRFETLPQINNFNFTGGDNRINAIFLDETTAYLAAGYGVSALDLERSIFRFTTFTGVAVQSVVVFENRVWAGTSEGIYRAGLTGVNLDDFTNWDYLGTDAGFPALYETTTLGIYQNELLFNIDRDLYRWTAAGPELFFQPNEPDRQWIPKYLSSEGENLLVGYRCRDDNCFDRRLFIFDAQLQIINNLTANCVGIVSSAVQDQQGRICSEMNGKRCAYCARRPTRTVSCSPSPARSVSGRSISKLSTVCCGAWPGRSKRPCPRFFIAKASSNTKAASGPTSTARPRKFSAVATVVSAATTICRPW